MERVCVSGSRTRRCGGLKSSYERPLGSMDDDFRRCTVFLVLLEIWLQLCLCLIGRHAEAEDQIYTLVRVNGGTAAASGMPCRRRWRAPGGDALSLAPDHVSLGITRPGVRFLDDACPIGTLAWNRDDASGTCRKQPRKPTTA
jgi:hypothetical protein